MELDSGIIYAFAADLLKEDLGRGDITTQSVVRGGARARARFLANQDLVLCGLEIAEAVFGALDNNVLLESTVYDGEKIAAGTEFARIEGPAAALLTGERTALNFLQRLSGIATLTRAFVDAVAATRATILDTRKTTPTLRILEKYAVAIGGGTNHRMGLYDAVMIKDNHHKILARLGPSALKSAVAAARKNHPEAPIFIEADTLDQVEAALAKGANQISGLEFYASKADDVRRAALANATAAARGDAEAMAHAAGGSLGPLLELTSVGVLGRPIPPPSISDRRLTYN